MRGEFSFAPYFSVIATIAPISGKSKTPMPFVRCEFSANSLCYMSVVFIVYFWIGVVIIAILFRQHIRVSHIQHTYWQNREGKKVKKETKTNSVFIIWIFVYIIGRALAWSYTCVVNP